MLHIQIIQVGKTKEKFFKDAENEFLKRLSRYAKVKVETVNDDSKILDRIEAGSFKVAMEITGEQYDSEQFADFIQRRQFEGGKVTFIIGGPLGLPIEVVEACDFKLSLSKMTFTHQMVRIFLLEQIYRAFTILEGKTYHH
ncbi:23S rRNA (pseudouridine(1915)-N(3))-methyltransferase RlmH [Patescibacteria group bacterium]